MSKLQAQTNTICPYCFRQIPARRIIDGDSLFLERVCPACGDLGRVLVWKNDPIDYREWDRNYRATETVAACTCKCGICPDHKQETCSAIIEVTQRCDLNCPICFASAGDMSTDPDLDRIITIMQKVLDHGISPPFQLSGGEPTLRDDLPQIVAAARKMGIDHIQINTNGRRLAQDIDYGKALKHAGATSIFLQFDGVTDDVYRQIRGIDLMSLKLQVVERCAELKLGVILTPTLVRGINDLQIGAIIQFAKKWIPTVKGVHFQPVTYLGRYPKAPTNEDRILIPEVLQAITNQTDEFRIDNFLPSSCEESHCSFSALSVLSEDNVLVPVTNAKYSQRPVHPYPESAAEHAREYVRKHWRYSEPVSNSEKNLLDRAKSHFLCISGMAFQDAWNLDLERLQRCCIHVATYDGRLVPFCLYYLTNSMGQRWINSLHDRRV